MSIGLYSPYITPAYNLVFGPANVRCTVTLGLFEKYPKLMDAFNNNRNWGGGSSLSLRDVNVDVGHILVHYLYTGTYQTLKPQNRKPLNILACYKEALSTYGIAHEYGLEDLKELALTHIHENEVGLSVYDKFDAAADVYRKLAEDEWFTEYLKKEVEAALEMDTALLANPKFSDKLGSVNSFERALLKVITEIYARKVETLVANASSMRPDLSHPCVACGCGHSEATKLFDATTDGLEYTSTRNSEKKEINVSEPQENTSATVDGTPTWADGTPVWVNQENDERSTTTKKDKKSNENNKEEEVKDAKKKGKSAGKTAKAVTWDFDDSNANANDDFGFSATKGKNKKSDEEKRKDMEDERTEEEAELKKKGENKMEAKKEEVKVKTKKKTCSFSLGGDNVDDIEWVSTAKKSKKNKKLGSSKDKKSKNTEKVRASMCRRLNTY
jgi:hypothetical protein